MRVGHAYHVNRSAQSIGQETTVCDRSMKATILNNSHSVIKGQKISPKCRRYKRDRCDCEGL